MYLKHSKKYDKNFLFRLFFFKIHCNFNLPFVKVNKVDTTVRITELQHNVYTITFQKQAENKFEVLQLHLLLASNMHTDILLKN